MRKEDKSTPVLISGRVHPELAGTFQRIVRFVGGNPNHAMAEIVKAAEKDRDFQLWLKANPDQPQAAQLPMTSGKKQGKTTQVVDQTKAQTA